MMARFRARIQAARTMWCALVWLDVGRKANIARFSDLSAPLGASQAKSEGHLSELESACAHLRGQNAALLDQLVHSAAGNMGNAGDHRLSPPHEVKPQNGTLPRSLKICLFDNLANQAYITARALRRHQRAADAVSDQLVMEGHGDSILETLAAAKPSSCARFRTARSIISAPRWHPLRARRPIRTRARRLERPPGPGSRPSMATGRSGRSTW